MRLATLGAQACPGAVAGPDPGMSTEKYPISHVEASSVAPVRYRVAPKPPRRGVCGSGLGGACAGGSTGALRFARGGGAKHGPRRPRESAPPSCMRLNRRETFQVHETKKMYFGGLKACLQATDHICSNIISRDVAFLSFQKL
jgi:hypothetical protein